MSVISKICQIDRILKLHMQKVKKSSHPLQFHQNPQLFMRVSYFSEAIYSPVWEKLVRRKGVSFSMFPRLSIVSFLAQQT